MQAGSFLKLLQQLEEAQMKREQHTVKRQQ